MDSALMMAQIKSQPDLVTLEWLFELIRAEVLKLVKFAKIRKYYIGCVSRDSAQHYFDSLKMHILSNIYPYKI